LPFVGWRKSVELFRNVVLKTASIQKKANFAVFSSAKELSLHLSNFVCFSL